VSDNVEQRFETDMHTYIHEYGTMRDVDVGGGGKGPNGREKQKIKKR